MARSRSLELVKLTDVVLVLYVGRYPEKARRQVLDKPRLRDGGNDEFRSKTLASLELHSQHCLHLKPTERIRWSDDAHISKGSIV